MPHDTALPARIRDEVAERLLDRPPTYCPWGDLRRRSGVDLRWHGRNERLGFEHFPMGVTRFDELAVSLQVGNPEVGMRCTLAHELVHLERGPVPRRRTCDEERSVDNIAAQRLVDPIIYDALTRGGRTVTAPERLRLLRVSAQCLHEYTAWRSRVTPRTALARYEEFGPHNWPSWPAPWVDEHRDEWPLAASFAVDDSNMCSL